MSSSDRHQAPIRPGAIYRLAADLEALPADLTLYNVEWGVLFAVSGEHTVAEIGDHFGLDEATARGVFHRLAAHGLVEERPVGHGAYLRAQATVADRRPRTLAAFLRGAAAPPGAPSGPAESLAEPGATVPVVPPANQASPPPPPTGPASGLSDPWPHDQDLTRPVPTVRRSDVQPGNDSIRFQPLDAPETRIIRRDDIHRDDIHRDDIRRDEDAQASNDQEAARQLSLERMMRFIIDRAPDLNAGQLDVYRVFIRVDTKLLKRNGITTLRFADDHLIGDLELQQAIATSVSRTLGIDVPDTVYVAA